MSLINLSLVFIAALNGAMAALIFFRNPKNKINISFSITLLFLTIWIIGMVMFREAESEKMALLWTWIQNGFGSYLAITFFLFAIYFPYQNFILKNWQKSLIVLSIVVITLIVIMPGVWVTKINFIPHSNDYDFNRLGLIYFNLHFLFYVFSAFYILINKYKISQGVTKRQLGYLIVATGFMVIFGTAFAAIYPLFTATLGPYWMAAYFTIPMILVISHLIFQK